MAVWNLTEGNGLIFVFIKVFEGADTREGQTEKNWAKLHEGACWL
jgi:hypothetical protein